MSKHAANDCIERARARVKNFTHTHTTTLFVCCKHAGNPATLPAKKKTLFILRVWKAVDTLNFLQNPIDICWTVRFYNNSISDIIWFFSLARLLLIFSQRLHHRDAIAMCEYYLLLVYVFVISLLLTVLSLWLHCFQLSPSNYHQFSSQLLVV